MVEARDLARPLFKRALEVIDLARLLLDARAERGDLDLETLILVQCRLVERLYVAVVLAQLAHIDLKATPVAHQDANSGADAEQQQRPADQVNRVQRSPPSTSSPLARALSHAASV